MFELSLGEVTFWDFASGTKLSPKTDFIITKLNEAEVQSKLQPNFGQTSVNFVFQTEADQSFYR